MGGDWLRNFHDIDWDALRRKVREFPLILDLDPLTVGESLDLGEVSFPEGRAVSGCVLGPAGVPVAGALIDGYGQSTHTDALGRYEFKAPAGKYRLWLSSDVLGLISGPELTVRDGETTTIDFSLQ